MKSNADRFRNELDALVTSGNELFNSLQRLCLPEEFEAAVKKSLGAKAKAYIATLPSFKEAYQSWYSEAKALVKQVLPDRLEDFVRHYERPKSRKELTYDNYRIEDALQGLHRTRWGNEVVVDSRAALSHMTQQLAIVKAARDRFDKSLVRYPASGDGRFVRQ